MTITEQLACLRLEIDQAAIAFDNACENLLNHFSALKIATNGK